MAQILCDPVDHGGLMVSLVAGEGCAAHPWLHSAELNAGTTATGNIADLVHMFSLLHGTAPGLIETVARENVWAGADAFLREACAGFVLERAYLADVIASAGPTPSTPGDSGTVSAILAQRQSLDTIARSERFGCAIGAAVALLLDWQPLRATIDGAAERLGLAVPATRLPDDETCRALLAALPERPRLDRTLAFGARQLLAHHSGLLDYLSIRADARGCAV
ncbi:DUF6975 family protein [Sphingomonas bacterium]|uniref:DUF6975 family protein n=1 Tax=Sphingomonas bacterium TaxID=1895847 RepID=UPI00157656CD|nr:hypothetical protein [Sphingomonas bacterium]